MVPSRVTTPTWTPILLSSPEEPQSIGRRAGGGFGGGGFGGCDFGKGDGLGGGGGIEVAKGRHRKHHGCVERRRLWWRWQQIRPDGGWRSRKGATLAILAMEGSRKGPHDHYCWERPEDMDYKRQVQTVVSGPDLAGEMAAALASASIVFRDDGPYSQKLLKGATALYKFARDNGKRSKYSQGNMAIAQFYNSTGYYDECMWAAAWMYYATGNSSYLSLATNPGIPRNSHAFLSIPDLGVLSWDNKLPAAQLLLTRLRIFLNPGYPYEETLMMYHNVTGLNMCSYLEQFNVFNWTRGGMIQLNHGRPQPVQHVANAAFLASLYADYLNATGVPGWYCGPNYFPASQLRHFATSQVNYILGANPMKMSYVVGYGAKYPKHVHHRGASIPHDGKKYSCTGGWKWRDARGPNPNIVTGAMVGRPDKFDGFKDVRTNYTYTEPTLAGNAGLAAALISLTNGGGTGTIDKNSIFSAVPPLYPMSPPHPPPWRP